MGSSYRIGLSKQLIDLRIAPTEDGLNLCDKRMVASRVRHLHQFSSICGLLCGK